jgi:hypothetical protein
MYNLVINQEETKMDAEKLVKTYIKIRAAKETLVKAHDAEVAKLQADMDAIEQELLELCKSTGQDGGKTAVGTFTRTVKARYWSGNWDAMYRFIKENDAPHLLERRISQTEMKEFLRSNPDKMPEGLNIDSRYAVTVRRATPSKT